MFRIHFDLEDGRQIKMFARLLASAYDQWQSGTLKDSSLTVYLDPQETDGLAKMKQVFDAAQSFEIMFELLP